ncbi:MAG: orotidine-5'-phosphate decarboxylase [Candidatus Niyogibacteria bacterium]|nr:orotidine-5'-phosphate decarboxylase [Candidatus Niyogibacteria bacterium]
MLAIPRTPWLFPEEHTEAVSRLLELKLLKFDNKRSLPLKSGGKTDVYINLRDARDNPKAIKFITDLFAIPMQRLRPDRFVEIPDSVSCFAGPLSVQTGIPYLTIRQQAKEGRVANANVIGHANEGELVALLDDVITDGESKISPSLKCNELGLKTLALIVLVDRQQGWKELLLKRGVALNVWAGMTLHDVRRQLIRKLCVMQRCAPEIEEKNPIIVALDGKNWDEILPVIDPMRVTGCILKVNDLLIAEGANKLLPDLSVYGRVMVDIKEHDIPNTAANACKRLCPYNPWAVTVHASGGPEMIRAAVKAFEGTDTMVLAVTVLTSIDPETCEEIYTRRPAEQAMQLAEMAVKAGARGLVSSPEEARELKNKFPETKIITPGVRSKGKEVHDQARIATPKGAVDNGADYIVMGRQLLGAPDPVAETARVLKEELEISL